MFINPGNSGDNALTPGPGRIHGLLVRVRTLDSLVKDEGQAGPFVIKVDVQGYEPSVLRGGRKTFLKSRFIVSEFWPFGLLAAGTTPSDYLEQVKAIGFKVLTLNGRPLSNGFLEKVSSLGSRDPYVTLDLLLMGTHI